MPLDTGSAANYTPIYMVYHQNTKRQNPNRLMQPYAEKTKMAKNGLEKVKWAFLQNREDLKKTPRCSRANLL